MRINGAKIRSQYLANSFALFAACIFWQYGGATYGRWYESWEKRRTLPGDGPKRKKRRSALASSSYSPPDLPIACIVNDLVFEDFFASRNDVSFTLPHMRTGPHFFALCHSFHRSTIRSWASTDWTATRRIRRHGLHPHSRPGEGEEGKGTGGAARSPGRRRKVRRRTQCL